MAIRTESMTIRIDPRTKYLAQLAALQHRLTLSSLVDSALIETVKATMITEDGKRSSLLDAADDLWADHEADRTVMLAERFPFFLSAQQEWIWDKVQGAQKYWLRPLSEGLCNVA